MQGKGTEELRVCEDERHNVASTFSSSPTRLYDFRNRVFFSDLEPLASDHDGLITMIPSLYLSSFVPSSPSPYCSTCSTWVHYCKMLERKSSAHRHQTSSYIRHSALPRHWRQALSIVISRIVAEIPITTNRRQHDSSLGAQIVSPLAFLHAKDFAKPRPYRATPLLHTQVSRAWQN